MTQAHDLGGLAPLQSYRQWLPVLIVPRDNGKADKLPMHYAAGTPCDAHDPAHWTDYTTAAGLAASMGAAGVSASC